MDGPVIVAMVVYGAMAIEKQSVLAVLQAQGAVRAEEEGVTVLGVSVRVDPMGVGAKWRAQQGGCFDYQPKRKQNNWRNQYALFKISD